MRTKRNDGFTLVEILIVVVILGILAAIVIPQFSQASTDAKKSSLSSNLQTIRSQIALYKIQHTGDAAPTLLKFEAAMTQWTNAAGDVSAVVNAAYPYGPYLQTLPRNPVTGDKVLDAGVNKDWQYIESTGEFNAGVGPAPAI